MIKERILQHLTPLAPSNFLIFPNLFCLNCEGVISLLVITTFKLVEPPENSNKYFEGGSLFNIQKSEDCCGSLKDSVKMDASDFVSSWKQLFLHLEFSECLFPDLIPVC